MKIEKISGNSLRALIVERILFYIEVFRGLKFESDPGGIGFAFHRAGAEIAENSHFWMGTS